MKKKQGQAVDVLALTGAQEGILLETDLSGNPATYAGQSVLEVGAANPDLIQEAVDILIARHEGLRTSFHWKKLSRPVAVVHEHAEITLVRNDLSDVQDAELEAKRLFADDLEQGFDYTEPPLLRVRLVQLSPDRSLFGLTTHHVALDGWSTALVLAELREAYVSLAETGTASFSRPVPPRLRAYAAWLSDREDMADFWRETLAEVDLPTPLPIASGAEGTGSDELEESVDSAVAADVDAFCRQARVTRAALVNAVWGLTLATYAGCETSVHGLVVSGRPPEIEGSEGMVGMFVNTVPLRVDVAGNRDCAAFVSGVQALMTRMKDAEHASLSDIIRAAEIDSGEPFASIVVVQNHLATFDRGGNENSVAQGWAREETHYPLALVVSSSRILNFRLAYDCGRYSKADARRLLDCFMHLLAAVVAEPDRSLLQLNLTSDRRSDPTASSGAEEVFPGHDRRLEDLVLSQAASTPDAVAVIFGKEEKSYASLGNGVRSLSKHLACQGIGRGDIVGVLMERSLEMPEVLLGIMASGAAYLPLDPDLPDDRLAYIVEDADVAAVVEPSALVSRLPEGRRAVVLDQPGEDGPARPGARSAGGPDDAAYVIYTSGSTGRPKGVVVPHDGVVNRILALQSDHCLAATDRVLQKTPFSFDVSVWELFWPLVTGAGLVMARPGGHRDPAWLAEEIARTGVSVVHFVPSMLRQYTAQAPVSPGVRLVACTGEVLGPDQPAAARSVFPEAEIRNFYGPTEASIEVSSWRCEPKAEGPVPIGRAIANLRLYVMDAHGRVLPDGACGELVVAGPCVASGYLGRPGLTAAQFVPDPYGPPGARAYRTGDLVRRRGDGALDYLGRNDGQVKVRGHRIELGEVEAAMAAVDGVREVAAIVRADGSDMARLVGYVVGGPGPSAVAEEMSRHLPGYMIPTPIIELDAMPMTASGKTDRKKLPAPASALQTVEIEPPQGATEEALAEIVRETTGVERVGRDMEFVSLGANSIDHMRIASLIRRQLSVDIALREVFESPTVAALARRVEAAQSGDGEVEARLTVQPRPDRLPLSFAQERLWFLDQLSVTGAAYNMPIALRLEGRLEMAALEAAFAGLVARHETLRTRFTAGPAGQPEQHVDAPGAVCFDHRDLSGETDPDAAARALIDVEAVRSFDLAEEQPLRVLLMRLGADRHVLLVTLHHIAADGWSLGVVVRDLTALYAEAVGGPAAALPGLPVQYADYALWQRDRLSGARLDAELDWWRGRLEGAPVLDLPTDRPRPPVQDFAGATIPVHLPVELMDGLSALSRREGATLFMTLLASFSVLLGRHAGQEDVVVGAPIANRTRAETEDLVGFFVNTLALRTELSDDPDFVTLLGRVRDETLAAYQHQDVPFERLVEALAPARDLSRHPLFQVALVLQNAPGEALHLDGLTAEVMPRRSTGAKFDLTLFLSETKSGLRGRVEYASGLFDARTMTRLMARFETLLTAILENPGKPVGDYPLLARDEVVRQKVIGREAWDNPYRLHDLVFAEGRDDLVALDDHGRRLTFAALRDRAEQIAGCLQKEGVGPDTVVAICAGRSACAVAAMLAVSRAGGAFVFLDPSSPPERIAQMVEDAGVGLALADDAGRAVLPSNLMTLPLDVTGDAVQDCPAHPDNLAYVIYTSGSTGRPKGVLAHHRGAVNVLTALVAEYAIAEDDVVLQVPTFTFDASIRDIFGTLAAGARLVLSDSEEAQSPEALCDLIDRHGVTAILSITPARMAALAAARTTKEPSALRLVLVAGEPLSSETCRAFRAAFGSDIEIVNQYGATECTMASTAYRAPLTKADGALSVGDGVAGMHLGVFDTKMRMVPDGGVGEAYIGGPNLARGYLGNPRLTAERFLPDPAGSGDRVYRTGDKIRRRGGVAYILGRLDEQVKIRGQRVEPGEVEAYLTKLPEIRQAVVVPMQDGQGLVGYLVPSGSHRLSSDSLHAVMRKHLPLYMVPGAFVWLDALPMTVNGKTDVAALPVPNRTRADLSTGYEAPRTAVEELLAGIWSDVLDIPQIGVSDDVFALGAHSLLVTRVVSLIRRQLSVDIALREVFESPTVAALARRVEAAQSGDGEVEARLTVQPRPDRLPLSFAQERLWFLDQLSVTGAAYNMPIALRLEGRLEMAALEAAFAGLVARHETLRTRFTAGPAGQPEQHVDAPGAVCFDHRDLSGETDPDAAARALIDVEAVRSFDLAEEQPLRVLLMRLGADRHVLLVTLHHIAADGWSLGVVVRDLTALYAEAVGGPAAALPGLPVQYADYALWQRDRLSGARLDAELDWWRGRLEGAPVLDLPTDRPRPPVQDFAGATIPVHLPVELMDGLSALSRREGATLFMTLLASFSVLLGRHAGQEDVVVGAPIANRTRAETEDLVGFFVNTLALRTELSDDPDFVTLLGRVRDETLAAYQHQDVPFERLVEALAPARDLSRHPLFQVALVLQNAPGEALHLDGLTAEVMPRRSTGAKFDLTLFLSETKSGLRGRVEYASGLFDARTMTRLMARFETLLTAILENPGKPVGDYPMSIQTDLVHERTGPAGPRMRIEEVVSGIRDACGERIALEDGEDVLSYAELVSASDALSGRIASAGVMPGQIVGVALERSANAIIAQLAVLRAGGVVLPLDPDYPPERLEGMLADSDVPLVLSDTRHQGLAGGRPVLLVDEADINAEDVAPPPRLKGLSGAPAYVIYTSGSTGRPKGVMVPHEAVTSLFLEREVMNFGPDDRVMLASPLAFDASLIEIWGALLNGSRLAVLPAGPFDPDALSEFVADAGVTVAWLTAGLLRGYLERDPSAFAGLRLLMSGGDVFPTHGLSDFMAGLPNVQFVNGYGPTECTTFTAMHRLDFVPEAGSAVPIGRGVGGRRPVVLDRSMRAVPPGAPGELYVGGHGLSLGYLGQPGRTAESFLPDPAGGGGRLYRTGDRVRLRSDGALEFLGRIDAQVKLRGFRVEPGEVEAALCALPAVGDGAVAVRRDGEGAATLEGFVVPVSGVGTDARSLEQALGERLPSYMVPRITLVESLPLDANGKVDRRSLVSRLPERVEEAGEAPHAGLEKTLAEIWQRVLGRSDIRRADDFFSLGGHSLLAMRVATTVTAETGHPATVRDIFEYPTIEKLALHLAAANQNDEVKRSSGILPLAPGHGLPTFLIHPGGGGVGAYRRLAGLLDEGPVYGVFAGGLEFGTKPLTSITEMADSYVEQIRQECPVGPIRLGGWSFGGVVAVEVARRLGSARVVQLVLIDPSQVADTPRPAPTQEALDIAFEKNVAGLAKLALGHVEEDAEAIARARDVFIANVTALVAHCPEAYSGPVTILFGEDSPAISASSVWQKLLPNGFIRVLPGDHYTLLTGEALVGVANSFARSSTAAE
ncbi:non-ribosomal peptide synthetase [Aestuariispira ectoiniformans]|uniref:non-ribosomal peptide synthetase n=1 Tax=Aestuariispira ectoiniformans TaxID=2775080 RepID=UPI00223B1E0A|nr:non-ribosomal peptide synthetase [Aestuariispira ectoiniformans]